MFSERWRKAQLLFEELLELAEKERRPALRQRCGDDEELQKLILSLVTSHETSGEFLSEPLLRLEPRAMQEFAPLAVGERVGAYRILEPIGEGGMSTVYLAERSDSSFELRVVVKVVRHGLETEENLRRLRIERQILAGLNHPNISRLYDGGTTAERLPFFVMEFVEGDPIDRYCDDRRLTVRERVRLFAKVCEAVGYAHQRLVVHRDLKPDNLLVTAAGEPKLLDFGIAKLLQEEGVEEPARTTAFLRRLTPDYASPEQIRGDRITTSSDVYSLGMILYFLLVGTLPRSSKGRSLEELEKAIQEEVPLPSLAVAERLVAETCQRLAALRGARPEAWRRQLKGDLDAIVVRALRPEAEDRYSSVEELSRDLENHLLGFPVQTRPSSNLYRLRKFLARNRAAAAAAAALILLAAATVESYVRHAQSTALQRDELEAIVASVKGLLEVAGEGEHLTARQIVDRSSAMVEKTIAGRPELEGTVRDTMGSIYLNLGLPEQAREQLERASSLRRAVHGPRSLAAAASQSSLALAAARADDLEGAEKAARAALEVALEKIDRGSTNLVPFLNNLVTVLCYKDDYSAAEPFSETAASLAESLPESRVEKAKAFANRAFLLAEEGVLEEAARLYERALKLHRRYRGEEHPEVLGVMNNLSLLLGDLGQHEKSVEILRSTLKLQRKLLGAQNPEVIRTLNNLSSSLQDQGDLVQAEAIQREGVALAQEVLPPGHFAQLLTETRLAEIQIETGLGSEAARNLEIGMEIWREALADSWFLAHAESVLGSALASAGQLEEAEVLLARGYQTLREIQGANFQRTQAARQRLDDFVLAHGGGEKLLRLSEEKSFSQR